MIGDLSRVQKIYLVTGRTDMRKSFDGLMAVIRDNFQLDPFTNAVFLFCGRKNNTMNICCSSYDRPRSKNYHWTHFKKLLKENHLPDIRWHDLRSTYCTLLLKNNYSPKAISQLMGHSKEIITVDVYGDNSNLIAEPIPELEKFMEEVLPERRDEKLDEELLNIEIDVSVYLP